MIDAADIPCFPGRLEDESRRPLTPDIALIQLNLTDDVDEKLKYARYLRQLAFRGIFPTLGESGDWYARMCETVTELKVRKYLMG